MPRYVLDPTSDIGEIASIDGQIVSVETGLPLDFEQLVADGKATILPEDLLTDGPGFQLGTPYPPENRSTYSLEAEDGSSVEITVRTATRLPAPLQEVLAGDLAVAGVRLLALAYDLSQDPDSNPVVPEAVIEP